MHALIIAAHFIARLTRTPSTNRLSACHSQSVGKTNSSKPSGCTMTNATLLSESGVVIVLAGGALAYRGERYIENQDTVERVAGFLLIAGLACIGASLGLVFDSPFP
jgi:hypothetical protein